jgi:integrase
MTARPLSEFAEPSVLYHILISHRLDIYIDRFRPRIPRSSDHDGLWASIPMDAGTIYAMFRRRTFAAFGVPISLHRARSGAGTFWSIHDPANARGVKDLLGHASFETTEKYYIMAQFRLAGRSLQQAIQRAYNERGPK